MKAGIQKAKQTVGRALGELGLTRKSAQISQLRRRFVNAAPGSLVKYSDFELRITDGRSFFIQIKDEFVHGIYHFETDNPRPVIIDGGSNIGVSILYFKRLYPTARIIGFEPDPAIFRMLSENIGRNNLKDVKVFELGLGDSEGTTTFLADNSASGQFGEGENSINVRVTTLSKYIDGPIDFLKLNIEGQELPVLQELEASGKLGYVRELVFEYHGWAGQEQRLGELLSLLNRNGFRYFVHDFDDETGYATKPPFRWRPETVWFCLVYAIRPGKNSND
ncbi:MAG TPA: FkbM family methyltransferase [Pyrinomonadaceae bacterium]